MSATANKFRECNLCHTAAKGSIFNKNGYDLVRCADCGLVYVGCPPSAAELEKLYSFANGYHTSFEDDNSPSAISQQRWAKYYLELINRYGDRGRVLDVGCSVGFFLEAAKKDGWQTQGLEMSADSAEIARSKRGLEVEQGTLESASFAPASFDAVTVWDVIEHVTDPADAMMRMNRLLKPGGIVAMSTPNVDGIFPRWSLKVAQPLNYWPHPEPPYHLFQFSKRTIRRLLEQTGFEVVAIVDKNISISFTFGKPSFLAKTPKYLLYALAFAPLAKVGPWMHSGDWMLVVGRKKSEAES
jgi:2-polyprenyl-3-methyl-5-hydroxy-6-metoxy-1,4-benzoquinol methylase